MPYLPDELTTLTPPPEDLPFWENCKARRLTFQKCPKCETVVHPPMPMCPACQSIERGWVEAPTEARIFSLTWAYAAAHESLDSYSPYNIALVEFPALPGVRFITNVVDLVEGEAAIGLPVVLAWDETADGRPIPRFRKA